MKASMSTTRRNRRASRTVLLRAVGKLADMILWTVFVIRIRDETKRAQPNIGLKYR